MLHSAAFSPCRTWRYGLIREWDAALPTLTVIGLNPSTADETQDDPTIRRCLGFARSWGCGRLVMVNLFAFRSTGPAALKRATVDIVGPDNDAYLHWAAEQAASPYGILLAAWGTHGTLFSRGHSVRRMLRTFDLRCLEVTKDGHPRHPLYARADLKPQPYLYRSAGAVA